MITDLNRRVRIKCLGFEPSHFEANALRMLGLRQHPGGRGSGLRVREIEIELLNSSRENDLEGLEAIGWEFGTEFATT